MPSPVAFHEASHAAAMMLLNLPPKRVRTDAPREGVAGHCIIDWGEGGANSFRKLRDMLTAIVVGGLTNGVGGWTFPIDPDRVALGSRSDARMARYLAEALGYDEIDWPLVLLRARSMADRPEFRRLVIAIGRELEEVEVLERDDLIRIHEAAREETTTCNT
jgi:hypothetical protein